MRVMLMIKGDPEPVARPSEELLAAMGSYNDELKKREFSSILPGSTRAVKGSA